MDNAEFEKVMLLEGDMMTVETELEVDVIESLVKKRRRQEDQVKTPTTKTLTAEEVCHMRRLQHS